MDHNIPLQLRYLEIHLTIPTNRCYHLPKTIKLFYVSSINETRLEIIGERILSNKSASIVLHQLRSGKAAGESEMVFASMDRIYAGDGFNFEVYIRGEKALKGFFWHGVRWDLEGEAISLVMRTKVSVVTDQEFLITEKARLRRNRFYLDWTSILEEDEEDQRDDEEDVKREVTGSDYLYCVEKREGWPRWRGNERIKLGYKGRNLGGMFRSWVICL